MAQVKQQVNEAEVIRRNGRRMTIKVGNRYSLYGNPVTVREIGITLERGTVRVQVEFSFDGSLLIVDGEELEPI